MNIKESDLIRVGKEFDYYWRELAEEIIKLRDRVDTLEDFANDMTQKGNIGEVEY